MKMGRTVKRKRRMASIGLGAAETIALVRKNPSRVSTLRCVLLGLLRSDRSESFAQDLLTEGVLELLPCILRQSSEEAAAVGVDLIGALSMSSFEVHCRVVRNEGVICALTETLTSSNLDLLTSACHAVVDLLITPFSREVLKDSCLLESLLRLLCLTADLSRRRQEVSLAKTVSSGIQFACEPVTELFEPAKASGILETAKSALGSSTSTFNYIKVQSSIFCSEFDDLIMAALTSISTLIHSQGVVSGLRDLFLEALTILLEYWRFVLQEDRSTAVLDGESNLPSSERRQKVARCLMQLGMELECFLPNRLQEELFGIPDLSMQVFIEKHWEQSPALITRQMPSCLHTFVKGFESVDKLVSDLLSWSVACPQAFADQVDSLSLLEDIESNLGQPMIYGQDIRMVKTVVQEPDMFSLPESEVHFFGNNPPLDTKSVRHVQPHDAMKAIEMGYTIAIKGMELRCPHIAKVSESLAQQFGQPSVGVNLYLTPPDAQGLQVHFDDHCVFVCQLHGRKEWEIFPEMHILPRLYACRSLDREVLESSPSALIDLEEGEVLYIPRGFPHNAHSGHKFKERGEGRPLGIEFPKSEKSKVKCCFFHKVFQIGSGDPVHDIDGKLNRENCAQEDSSTCCNSTTSKTVFQNSAGESSYSLHLTFGVEVEPPFEWEGLVHIALRLWAKQRWQDVHFIQGVHPGTVSNEETNFRDDEFCEALLHIAIRELGEKEVGLRKACMIAASTYNGEALRECLTQECPEHNRSSNCVSGCGVADCGSCDPASLGIFQQLISLVVEKASFNEAYDLAKQTSQESYGLGTGGMEWLRHVSLAGENSASLAVLDPVLIVKDRIHLNESLEPSSWEATFGNLKAEFGTALMFHQASEVFRNILRKYRTVRRKFMNGMLTLHGYSQHG